MKTFPLFRSFYGEFFPSEMNGYSEKISMAYLFPNVYGFWFFGRKIFIPNKEIYSARQQ